MAIAAATANTTGLPPGYVSPFARVPMQERIDDALACLATVSGKTLAEVNAAAIQAGYPAHGPAWVTYALIAKLLPQLNSVMTARDYVELPSVVALPDLALLLVDYDPDTEVGRHVVWHRVRATDKQPEFRYVIDPAPWIEAKHHVTSDLRHLNLTGAYYIEIRQQSYAAAKGR